MELTQEEVLAILGQKELEIASLKKLARSLQEQVKTFQTAAQVPAPQA